MKINYKGYEILIEQDSDPLNPREQFENLGTMFCMHRNYNLGDNKKATREEIKDILEGRNKDVAISLPLYLYDHSGITMNTTGFSCPWDSGIVGTIFVLKDTLKKHFSVKCISKRIMQMARNVLENEVKDYDDYITGNVYGFHIKQGDEVKESSFFGFYGDDGIQNATENAKEIIDEWEEKKVTA